MSHFMEHGKYEISVDGQLLLLDATGPFNAESVSRLKLELQQFIDQVSDSPWGEVAVLHDESAYTPDALEILKLSVQQRIEQNMQVIAIQFEQPRSRMLTEHQLLEVFNQFDTLEFAFFE